MIYLELLLIALVAIFIVDLSGFTPSWKGALAKIMKRDISELPSLHPFDCSLCATWWSCIIYAICVHQFSVLVLAYIALVSYLTAPMGRIMMALWEKLMLKINEMYD